MIEENAVTAALTDLYNRVTRLAEDMNGATYQPSPGILRAEMPDNFVVTFTRTYVLGGDSFPLIVTRSHHGKGKTGRNFIYERGTWTSEPGQPLSDDALRKCLTPEGPPVI